MKDKLLKNGGFTFNCMKDEFYKKGWVYSLKDYEYVIDNYSSLTEVQLLGYIGGYYREKFDVLIEDKGMALGAWVDDDKLYLDVSKVERIKDRALFMAGIHKQKSIYNLKTKKNYMGRSVDYLNNALGVLYLKYDDGSNDERDMDDSDVPLYSDWDRAEDWDYNKELICDAVKEVCPNYDSLTRTERWGNRETLIILESDYAIIGISEYCSLVSLSIALDDETNDQYWDDSDYIKYKYQIEEDWAKIEKAIQTAFPTSFLKRVGGFSDGTSIYEYLNKKDEEEKPDSTNS